MMTAREKQISYGIGGGIAFSALLATIFGVDGNAKFLIPFLGGAVGWAVAGELLEEEPKPAAQNPQPVDKKPIAQVLEKKKEPEKPQLISNMVSAIDPTKLGSRLTMDEANDLAAKIQSPAPDTKAKVVNNLVKSALQKEGFTLEPAMKDGKRCYYAVFIGGEQCAAKKPRLQQQRRQALPPGAQQNQVQWNPQIPYIG